VEPADQTHNWTIWAELPVKLTKVSCGVYLTNGVSGSHG
jgi:hypothetical protein